MEENFFRANLRTRPSFSISRRNSNDDFAVPYAHARPSFSNNDLFKALLTSLRNNPQTNNLEACAQ